MKKKKANKKGTAQMWTIISAMVIAIILILFISLMIKGGVDKAKDDISGRVDSLKDADQDGVVDLFDRCADSGPVDVDADGCTDDQKKQAEVKSAAAKQDDGEKR